MKWKVYLHIMAEFCYTVSIITFFRIGENDELSLKDGVNISVNDDTNYTELNTHCFDGEVKST